MMQRCSGNGVEIYKSRDPYPIKSKSLSNYLRFFRRIIRRPNSIYQPFIRMFTRIFTANFFTKRNIFITLNTCEQRCSIVVHNQTTFSN
ncbi:hypothetical protein SAMN05660479_01225 [Microbulbifer thermotolerans]|nr:hypothetical protein SAMN05660479_01225 [Microbulbifer thermotolerans]